MSTIFDQEALKDIKEKNAKIQELATEAINATALNFSGTQSGKQSFEIPRGIMGESFSAIAYCTISSDKLIQGYPIDIQVTIVSQNFPDITLAGNGFNVEPQNALFANEIPILPISDSSYVYPSIPHNTCQFPVIWCNSTAFESVWSGGVKAIFQDSGEVKLKISANIEPTNITIAPQNLPHARNLEELAQFNTTITIPKTNILSYHEAQTETLQDRSVIYLEILVLESQRNDIQQEIDKNRNIGLTFFVLSFAVVDIAIAIYSLEKRHAKQNSKYFDLNVI